jgi:predicted DsbA family dithiol-disulfide isomerase
MTQVKDIRKMYFEEGKNISQIARETGYDRKTVKKYLDKDDWNKELPKVKKGTCISKS